MIKRGCNLFLGLPGGGLAVVNLPAVQKTCRRVRLHPWSVSSPGGGNGNPPSILAWEIPWTEEPGRPHSMGSQKVGQNRATKQHHNNSKFRSRITSLRQSSLICLTGS